MKKHLEVGPENVQVCVYLCLHALGVCIFSGIHKYMFPASYDTIAMAWQAPTEYGATGGLLIECPQPWDEILVRGLT